MQKDSKVTFNKTLFSTSEDLDLVNTFSIVFIMVKEYISFNSFPNMSRGVSWTKNTEGVIDSTQVQYCVVGGCGEECGKEGEYY